MATRPDLTLVIRTQDLLLRADQGAGDLPVQLWRRSWGDLPSAVTHALSEGGPSAKRVWVLDSELWLGSVELASGAVVGLSDAELSDPAAFEAEALSEISPEEAITAVQRRRQVDAEDDFLVVQATKAQVGALDKAIRGARGRLAGLGHPAGFPRALFSDSSSNDRNEESWRRVEFWANAVVLAQSVQGVIGLFPLTAVPEGDWRRVLAPYLRRGEATLFEETLIESDVQVRGGASWQDLLADEVGSRWLTSDDAEQEDAPDSATLNLGDDGAAKSFAAAWLQALTELDSPGDSITPALRAPKTALDRWPAVAAGVAALILALTLVIVQRGQGQDRFDALETQLNFAQSEQQIVEDRRDQLGTNRTEVRSLERTIQSLEQELQQLIAQGRSQSLVGTDRREALAEMMTAIGQRVSDDIVIQSVENRLPRHSINGLSSTPDAASRLASDLNRDLRGRWQVSPARIEPQAGGEGLVWQFSITLEPIFRSRSSAQQAQ
ncbi:MAG: hypothetical protein AAGJ52_05810 [Pseudomonadota bacterium]